MIFVGTSGYSFRDWVGPFYPNGTKSQDMLARYARVFPAVEINATYYRLPPARTFQGMVQNSPLGFRFVVKLSGSLTHGDALSAASSLGAGRSPALPASGIDIEGGCRKFLEAIAPLEDAGRLDGILAQFPYRFREGAAGRERLAELRHHLGPRPLFVEFRHQSWARESTYQLLESLDAGLCIVDEPSLPGLFPPVVRQTSDVAYFRFHGRNAERWWDGDNSTRYDYLYDEEELREWSARIHDTAARTRQTFVFFNNCHGGSAPRNAEQMQAILGRLYAG
jgi:uncharacterized protein YecE (DUF72 family)